jgi:hypothetical protein
MLYKNIEQFAAAWQDSPEFAAQTVQQFNQAVNLHPIGDLRTYVEQHGYGFGERCFYWMWRLILNSLPPNPNLLEIGVYKGQVLALWRMLSKGATISGITPLDTSGGMEDRDYAHDIADLHNAFKLPRTYTIWRGQSDEKDPKMNAYAAHWFDVVYIDGGHSYREAKHDIEFYGALVGVNGYLVIDDCANKMQQPHGFFQGIESVSRAVDELLPPFTKNDDWLHLGCVVHNRIWRRVR